MDIKLRSMDKNTRVHFMGIGGSGMSAVAILAHELGFKVEGSEREESTPYLDSVKVKGIKVYLGHEKTQLQDVDILTVTPAVYFNQSNEFIEHARNLKIPVLTWQAFMGKYLQKDRRTICVAGTHGKSTTTTMLGLLYEKAGLDPTVEIGANVHEWGSNHRVGKSNIFVCEADEFYGNFLNYHPDVIILNNIEFDHPDFFESEEHVFDTFKRFIDNIVGEKTLIINQDSEGIGRLLDSLELPLLESLHIIGYTRQKTPHIEVPNSFTITDIRRSSFGNSFVVENIYNSYKETFTLSLLGDHNISNALGIIALSVYDKIPVGVVRKVVKDFKGTGRRMDMIGEVKEIKVYDDYAHHPTAIGATLSGLRQKYPKKKIVCVYEPHMFSRTKALLGSYKGIFKDADSVLITPIYRSRDKSEFGVSSQSIVDVSDHKDILAFDSYEALVDNIHKKVKKGTIIIVMGAGKSYQLARDILTKIS